MKNIFACLLALALFGLISACEDDSSEDCTIPQPSNSDTLHGRYTWTENLVSGVKTFTQLSVFQFRADEFGNPSRFTMRVDTTILNPARRFNDMTATYRLLSGTLIVDSITFQGNGGNSNVPLGVLRFSCTSDSFFFLGGSTPGMAVADTVMRIAIRR